jgi:hypothetical protein
MIMRNINGQLVKTNITAVNFRPQAGRRAGSPLVGFCDVYIDDIGLRDFPVFENPTSKRFWINPPNTSFVIDSGEIGYKTLVDLPAEIMVAAKEAIAVKYNEFRHKQLNKEPDWLPRDERIANAARYA